MRRALLLFLALAGCKFPTVGLTCKTHQDCAGFAEGYCSTARICTRECETDEQCPENTACTQPTERRVCLPTCEVSADCPAGFVCEGSFCALEAPFEPPAK